MYMRFSGKVLHLVRNCPKWTIRSCPLGRELALEGNVERGSGHGGYDWYCQKYEH